MQIRTEKGRVDVKGNMKMHWTKWLVGRKKHDKKRIKDEKEAMEMTVTTTSGAA